MSKHDEDEYNVGSLITYRNITDEQRNLFIKLLSDECGYQFNLLYNILEDNILFLQIIDSFANVKLVFPNRKKMFKLLEKIQIYTFCKSKNFSDDSYKLMAKQYGKRISQIRSIIDRVNFLIDNKHIN